MQRFPMTPAGYARMKNDLEHLKRVERPATSAAIEEARAHGDLKENAEYDAAKNEQGMMEARIRKLTHLLDSAEVREVENSGLVEVGTVVTVIDDDEDEYEFFVAPSENKVAGMLLASPQSPLGEALLGSAPGDEVSYEAPGGTFNYRIAAVRIYED